MKQSPKVLLTSLWLVPSSGGIPKTVSKFREALEAKVVSFTDAEDLAEEGSAFPGIEHVPLMRGFLGRFYGWAPRSKRAHAESLAAEADLLTCHVMLRYHANWVMKMVNHHEIPYWFIPHGQLDPYVYTYRAAIKKLWLWLFGKRLLRNAAHIIFSTEQERRKAAWFYEGANTRVVHWPVDLIDTADKRVAQAEIRKEIGASEGARVFVFLGRLHSMKRPLQTVEAFCRAARDEDAHLVLMGMEQGVRLEECSQLGREMGCADKVHPLGPVYGADKERYLLGADAYISLSKRENFGHTAAEALAAGTPVILSPGNDLATELAPRECGWFLKSDSMDEAVAAIYDCIDTEALEIEAKGRRGREFIAEECSFEGFAQALRELRNEAVGRAESQEQGA